MTTIGDHFEALNADTAPLVALIVEADDRMRDPIRTTVLSALRAMRSTPLDPDTAATVTSMWRALQAGDYAAARPRAEWLRDDVGLLERASEAMGWYTQLLALLQQPDAMPPLPAA